MIRALFRRGRHRPGPTRMTVTAILARIDVDQRLAAIGITRYEDPYSPTGWRLTA